jgi:hypothetical protein
MRLELVPTKKLHTVQLGCLMRPADVEECRALGRSSIEATFNSWKASTFCSSLLFDGELAGIGGVVVGKKGSTLGPRRGQAWMLTTALVEQHPMALFRTVRQWLDGVGEHVDILWNYVDARNAMSLSWVRGLGFRVSAAAPRGPQGLLFHLITRGP